MFFLFGGVGTLAYLIFGMVALTNAPSLKAGILWGSPIIIAYAAISIGFGYFGAQGVWLSELYPTEVRSTAQNLAYYVGRGLGAGLGPLIILAIATEFGGDLRAAITLGFIGPLGTALIAAFLPETRGHALSR